LIHPLLLLASGNERSSSWTVFLFVRFAFSMALSHISRTLSERLTITDGEHLIFDVALI